MKTVIEHLLFATSFILFLATYVLLSIMSITFIIHFLKWLF